MKTNIINSLKIVAAAVSAIVAAQLLHLDFAMSAGIIAILTIQPTKKETIRTALSRLCAFGAAMVIAFLSFKILGITLIGFFAYLLMYIFLCQFMRWHSAMAMNSVLISHFVSLGIMDMAAVRNEIGLFIIGVGIGFLVNLHLHKQVDYVEQLKRETDEQIIKILSRMSERIMNKDISDYNGECFEMLRRHIRKAKNVAEENFNNQFTSADTFDMEYIAMRDRQCQVLYEMYKNVRCLNTSPITAGKISRFMKNMAEVFERGNDGRELMRQFEEMDLYMKSQPLPTEREEFEDRARLFCLMRSVEEFIKIKVEFAQKYAN